MAISDRLQQQMDFLLELDRSKSVWRQTYLANADRRENDAEHSWHLAVMCLLLGEYANGEIDLLKTVTMVLFHDVIEIDAGDTYAYDEAGHETKAARESEAAKRLYGMLPEDQGERLRALWEEFETGETAEAKFARAMDNLQPLMKYICKNGFEHHVAMCRGNVKDILAEAIETYLNWNIYIHE